MIGYSFHFLYLGIMEIEQIEYMVNNLNVIEYMGTEYYYKNEGYTIVSLMIEHIEESIYKDDLVNVILLDMLNGIKSTKIKDIEYYNKKDFDYIKEKFVEELKIEISKENVYTKPTLKMGVSIEDDLHGYEIRNKELCYPYDCDVDPRLLKTSYREDGTYQIGDFIWDSYFRSL